MVFFILLDQSLELRYNKRMKNTDEDDDYDFSWAENFSKRMTKFGEKMAKFGEKMSDMGGNTIFNNIGNIDEPIIQGNHVVGDIVYGNSVVTVNGKTLIKKNGKKIVIDKDGNVTIDGKKVEKEKEEEKKPKHGHLEKLVDIPKIDDPNLFRNTIPTKVCVDKNLTTPLTLAHLDEYELKLTKLESKLEGRIEKLLIAVAVIGMMSLTTLFLLCINS